MPKHRATANRGAHSVLALLVLLALLTLTALWLFDDAADADVGPALLPGAAVADASPDQPDAAPRAETLAQPSALAEPSLAPGADAPAWPDDVREITLSGRVVDDFGAPWPNAQVVFAPDRFTLDELPEMKAGQGSDATANYPHARSDATGRFELRGPWLGVHARSLTALGADPMIVITGEGMAWHGYAAEGFRGASMDLGDLVLRHPGASLTLRAVDEAGAPLAGVMLNASSRTFQSHADDDPEPPNGFQGYALGPTDADGRLRAEHLWPSTLYAALEKPGWEGPSPEITLVGGELTELGELTLTRGRTQTGRVVDAAGQPVPDAQVVLIAGTLFDMLEREGSEELDAPALLFDRFVERAPHAAVGPDGGFSIEGVNRKLDDVLLLAGAPGFRRAALRTTFVDGAELTLVLERSGTLRVEVLSAADGTPLHDVELRALQHTGLPEVRPQGGFNSLALPYVQLEVGDDGRVLDAGPLDVELLVGAPGHLPLRTTAPRLAAGEQRALELRLEPGATPHGRVVDERGEPVVDASVELRPLKPFNRFYDTRTERTDADGRFAFPALLPGAWSGSATKLGHAEAAIEEFVSTEAQPELTLSMPRGARVHGTVRHADGEPAVAAWVRAARDDGLPRNSARSDRYGAYAFPGLQPGAWQISCPPGEPQHIDVAPGDDVNLDFTLSPSVRLSGVTRRGADPLPHVRISATELDPIVEDREISRSTRSRGDGSYAFELPVGGDFALHFYAREGTRLRREVLLRPGVETHLDVDFGTGSLAGRVTRAEGTDPLPERTRVVLHSGEERIDSMGVDELGRFRFAPLPAGGYTLSVNSDFLQPLELEPLELAAGEQRAGLELRVAGAAKVQLSVSTDDGSDFEGYVHMRRVTGGDEYRVRSVRSQARAFGTSGLPPGTWRLDLTTFEEPLLGHGEGLRGEPGAELPLLGGETVTLAAGEERRVELTVRSAALR